MVMINYKTDSEKLKEITNEIKNKYGNALKNEIVEIYDRIDDLICCNELDDDIWDILITQIKDIHYIKKFLKMLNVK